MARTVQPWNSIDLPNPVGKTPKTSWSFRIDSKYFTWSGLKLSDGSSGKIRPSEALIKTLVYPPSSMFCLSYAIVCLFSTPTNSECLVVMWPDDARAFSRPTSKAREKSPGNEVATTRTRTVGRLSNHNHNVFWKQNILKFFANGPITFINLMVVSWEVRLVQMVSKFSTVA